MSVVREHKFRRQRNLSKWLVVRCWLTVRCCSSVWGGRDVLALSISSSGKPTLSTSWLRHALKGNIWKKMATMRDIKTWVSGNTHVVSRSCELLPCTGDVLWELCDELSLLITNIEQVMTAALTTINVTNTELLIVSNEETTQLLPTPSSELNTVGVSMPLD